VRNLLDEKWKEPIQELSPFPLYIFEIRPTPDGKHVMVSGRHGDARNPKVSVAAFESDTGKRLWSISLKSSRQSVRLRLDPTGQVLALPRGDGWNILVNLGTHEQAYWSGGFIQALGPGGRLVVVPRKNWELIRKRDNRVLVRLGKAFTWPPQFSPDGTFLAWVNQDGPLHIANVEEVRRRLAEVDLGW
jgi:hypothetical protein